MGIRRCFYQQLSEISWKSAYFWVMYKHFILMGLYFKCTWNKKLNIILWWGFASTFFYFRTSVMGNQTELFNSWGDDNWMSFQTSKNMILHNFITHFMHEVMIWTNENSREWNSVCNFHFVQFTHNDIFTDFTRTDIPDGVAFKCIKKRFEYGFYLHFYFFEFVAIFLLNSYT